MEERNRYLWERVPDRRLAPRAMSRGRRRPPLHSGRQAVDDGAIDQPPLANWNEWQTWRASEGGARRGTRGTDEQKHEANLRRATILRHYGADYAEQLGGEESGAQGSESPSGEGGYRSSRTLAHEVSGNDWIGRASSSCERCERVLERGEQTPTLGRGDYVL